MYVSLTRLIGFLFPASSASRTLLIEGMDMLDPIVAAGTPEFWLDNQHQSILWRGIYSHPFSFSTALEFNLHCIRTGKCGLFPPINDLKSARAPTVGLTRTCRG
ncbi:hypothetical protein BD779DRAFT_509785 [Infundibulicybe gibba]|nr:hypothetical protein BD779DRAFT_509785 [Infundibulicybe gibba]